MLFTQAQSPKETLQGRCSQPWWPYARWSKSLLALLLTPRLDQILHTRPDERCCISAVVIWATGEYVLIKVPVLPIRAGRVSGLHFKSASSLYDWCKLALMDRVDFLLLQPLMRVQDP